jgi:hypothetical protein
MFPPQLGPGASEAPARRAGYLLVRATRTPGCEALWP